MKKEATGFEFSESIRAAQAFFYECLIGELPGDLNEIIPFHQWTAVWGYGYVTSISGLLASSKESDCLLCEEEHEDRGLDVIGCDSCCTRDIFRDIKISLTVKKGNQIFTEFHAATLRMKQHVDLNDGGYRAGPWEVVEVFFAGQEPDFYAGSKEIQRTLCQNWTSQKIRYFDFEQFFGSNRLEDPFNCVSTGWCCHVDDYEWLQCLSEKQKEFYSELAKVVVRAHDFGRDYWLFYDEVRERLLEEMASL